MRRGRQTAEQFRLRVDIGGLGRAEIEHQHSRRESENAVAQRLDPADVAASEGIVMVLHEATIASGLNWVNREPAKKLNFGLWRRGSFDCEPGRFEDHPQAFARGPRRACARKRQKGFVKEQSMPQPFHLRVPDSELVDLRERLARTRFPDSAPGEPWFYGTSVDYIRSLVEYWRSQFDWRAQEARLNAFPQFKMARPDCDLHFLHVPGKGPEPTPLLLMHGWPGSVFEFMDFIPRLTDPASFGGDPADAFTVVAPSLPGYGLSFRPGQKRFGVEEIADCLVDLMSDTLGYKRFAVQGGDWGGITAARMGYAHADKLIGIHVNLLAVRREPDRIKKIPLPRRVSFSISSTIGSGKIPAIRGFRAPARKL